MNRERLHLITNQKMLSASVKVGVFEAHADDAIMFTGATTLAQKGVGLSIATLTDGSARNLESITPEELRSMRRRESPNSVKIMGGAQVFNADLPDGQLIDYQEEAEGFLAKVIKIVQPDFLIAPHPEDPHSDHRAAAEVSKAVAGNEIPLYFTDTITGDGIEPTYYFALSEEAEQQRRNAYLAHKSQVTKLPPNQMKEVHAVLSMTQRRGIEIGLPYAGVVVQFNHYLGDPLGEILGGDVYLTS